MGTIKTVNSSAEFDALLNSTKSPPSLLVVDFWATWCGPCRVSMFPSVQRCPFLTFEKLPLPSNGSQLNIHMLSSPKSMLMLNNRLLRRIRSRQCKPLPDCLADSRPTFKLFKDGREIDSVRGADAATLEAKIKQHYVVPEESQNSSGYADSINGYPDITANIDVKNVHPGLTQLRYRWNV